MFGVRAFRAATVARTRVLPRGVARVNALQRYSGKKVDDKLQKSILTDDLLARAGFDDPDKDSSAQNEEPEGGEKTKSRRRKRAQTSKDLQRERYANYFYGFSLVAAVALVGYMCREWDSEEEKTKMSGSDADSGFLVGAVYGRFNKRLSSFFSFFSEPVFENLLPPPAPEAYRRPLTLVLTLDDLLIHSEWDTKNGWRTAKRPGLDYFLGYLSQYYEIVIFSSNSQMFSEKVVSKLDRYHAYISYALYREACRYKDGKLIKDLSLLNRDLGKTVMIDVNDEAWSLQPDNAIPMAPWDGTPDDQLIKLIPMLEYLATQPVKDVRPILNSFQDKRNIISEFEERERKLRAQWQADNKHLFASANRPNAGNFLAKLMGVPASSVNREPKMPLDIIREHGQKQYEHFQKYLKENGDKFIEEEEKLKEKFGKTSLNKMITEGAPTAEDIAKIQAEAAGAAE